jgi:hypothetical protein
MHIYLLEYMLVPFFYPCIHLSIFWVFISSVFILHFSQDLPLESLRQRLNDLSKSATVLNSNLRTKVPVNARWIHNITHPYSIIRSPCNQVKVALLGLLSDEPGIFRDNTFKRIPIGNVLDTYSNLHQQLIPTGQADLLVPLTHESIVRDRELAKHMLTLDSAGVIIGGHEHQPYDEFIRDANRSELSGVRITKSGMDANSVSLIDLTFEVSSDGERPKLAEIEYKLMEIKNLDPSFVVQKVVDKHMSVIKAMEDEYIIDGDTTNLLPPGVPLSSERTQFQQTTVGSIFCQMIKDEMEVDVAVVNGATFKGQKRYENNKISYAELKKELPFPTKLVVVPMKRWELEEAIHYSRTAYGNGTDLDAEEIPRKGFLQVDWAFDQMGETNGGHDDVLQVALPRNLLNGFCKIAPLMDIGARLNKEGTFPGTDDYVPAIDLIVRHLCKNRWYQIINRFTSFEELDLNNDGVLDRDEIKQMMKRVIGHEPADFVIDDMIASIDTDGNGVIDMGEFSYLLATMEREKNQW